MSEHATLFDRALYPLFSVDEMFGRRRTAGGSVEAAKEKVAEIIRNYFKIFSKIQIMSTDQYLLHDIFALLKKEGTPNDWHEETSIIYDEIEIIHCCTFSRARDLAKVSVGNAVFSHNLPSEIWHLIFEFVDWKTWLDLHLVSKSSRRIAQTTKSGHKLIEHLRSNNPHERDATFSVLKDFSWRRSPDLLIWMKQGKADIEIVLDNEAKDQPALPLFVPMISSKELRRIYKTLRQNSFWDSTGVSFRGSKDEFYIYYLQQADLFAVLKTQSTRQGAMGMPDTREHEESFYYNGDCMTIIVPARKYRIEYRGRNLISCELESLDQLPILILNERPIED